MLLHHFVFIKKYCQNFKIYIYTYNTLEENYIYIQHNHITIYNNIGI